MISAIVAVDSNYGIGNKNNLLAHIPEDLKMFKEVTTGGTVIMGRKTYESLPVKPLPDRINIVVTSKANNPYGENGVSYYNIEEVKIILKTFSFNNNFFVIGGGMIYKELLPCCERVYLTKILYDYDDVDTYFPNIDNMPEWNLTSESEVKEYNGVQYKFCIYDKSEA